MCFLYIFALCTSEQNKKEFPNLSDFNVSQVSNPQRPATPIVSGEPCSQSVYFPKKKATHEKIE